MRSSASTAARPLPAPPAGDLERLRSTLPAPLRRQLRRARELGPPASGERFPTAIEAVDRLLPGGLPRGRLVELVGRRSSGRFSLLLSALAAVTGGGDCAALVDLGDGLDARAAASAGVELERLLWLRPSHLRTALAAAEILAHCGFPLIALDLGAPPVPGGRGAEPSWLRLARAAVVHGSAVLVSSPYRVSGTAATGVLEARGADPLWHLAGSPLLTGSTCRVRLAKLRGTRAAGAEDRFRLLTPAAAAARLLWPRSSRPTRASRVEPVARGRACFGRAAAASA